MCVLSFPTRRSSDLVAGGEGNPQAFGMGAVEAAVCFARAVDSTEFTVCIVADPALGAGTAIGCGGDGYPHRSEEHTSELQSRGHLVCRLLHEKKKNNACGQTDWALSGRIYEVEENINTKNNQLMKKEDHLNRSQHMQDAGLSVYVVYLVC